MEQTDSDVFIALGDFNMNISNLEYSFFKNLTSLQGTTFQESNPEECTICPGNTFIEVNQGVLDYIFVSPRLRFESANIFLKDTTLVNGKEMSLSDHYGVESLLKLRPNFMSRNASLVKGKTKKEIIWLKGIVEKELAGIDDVFESQKGVEEKFCRSCRLKDVLEIVENYIKVLSINTDSVDQLNDHEKTLFKRLNFYFSLF